MKKLLSSIRSTLDYMIFIDPARCELKLIPVKINTQNLRKR